MKSNKSTMILILIMSALALLFFGIVIFTAANAYDDRRAAENYDVPDYYSMQKYSEKNSELVMSALKKGNTNKLAKHMINPDGIGGVMAFADWEAADWDNVTAMGAGSLSPGVDGNGQIDISERFFVDVGNTRYVLFVETLTSRGGRKNEGISAVAATTFENFDNLDFGWSGEADEYSALAGELYWNRNDTDEENDNDPEE